MVNGFWDRLGISASFLCILHCLLTPILVIAMPFLEQTFLHEGFHIAMVSIVVPVAIWALWNGYKMHRKKNVLLIGGIGLLFVSLAMTIGRVNFKIEAILMSIAGSLLAYAHWINLTVCRRHHD